MEITWTSNETPNNYLHEQVFEICKDSDITIMDMDIKGCHKLLLGRILILQVRFLKVIPCGLTSDICKESLKVFRGKEESAKYLSWSCCDNKIHCE